MLKSLVCVIFLFSLAVKSHSQLDTLNQTNEDDKKMGWWVVYLDEDFKITDDSTEAIRCMYNYYFEDIFLYRFGEGYGSRRFPIQFPEDDTVTFRNCKLLNGSYSTYFKNGNLRSVLRASKGYLIDFKRYQRNGQLDFEVIYSAACGAPIQHCLKEYNKDGSMKYDGHTYLPKGARAYYRKQQIYSDTTTVESGELDGKTFVIEVKQEKGQSHKPLSGWPTDSLKFFDGKMFSFYMQERERFYPAPYKPEVSQEKVEDGMSFKYENTNPGGSFLRIEGTVVGDKIKGTIRWTSAYKDITRTYSFEGALKRF